MYSRVETSASDGRVSFSTKKATRSSNSSGRARSMAVRQRDGETVMERKTGQCELSIGDALMVVLTARVRVVLRGEGRRQLEMRRVLLERDG